MGDFEVGRVKARQQDGQNGWAAQRCVPTGYTRVVLNFLAYLPDRTPPPHPFQVGTPAAGLHINLLVRTAFVAMVSSNSPGQWVVEPCLAESDEVNLRDVG